jgi:hypothetical protein
VGLELGPTGHILDDGRITGYSQIDPAIDDITRIPVLNQLEIHRGLAIPSWNDEAGVGLAVRRQAGDHRQRRFSEEAR